MWHSSSEKGSLDCHYLLNEVQTPWIHICFQMISTFSTLSLSFHLVELWTSVRLSLHECVLFCVHLPMPLYSPIIFPLLFSPSGDTLPISVVLAVASYFPWPPLTSPAYNSLHHLTFTIHLAYNYIMPSTVT